MDAHEYIAIYNDIPAMKEAIREIAESVEDGSWNGLTKRVEDILFPAPEEKK